MLHSSTCKIPALSSPNPTTLQIHSRVMYGLKYAIIACHMLFAFVVDRSARLAP
jgi:hypothetical protein